ncbi:MAG: isopeptide-forming domain-containing fimbrial protein, partial [Nitrososphaerota archaeon]|nr:isopeptide-forming domain-containing fimbrial protein [Nitrososphaerota archaeon]
MVFSMNVKFNTNIYKHKRFSRVFCLIIAFILIGCMMLPASADYVGTFVLVSVNPDTAFVTPDGSIHRLPDATYIQLFFTYETQTGTESIKLAGPALYLNGLAMPGIEVYAEFISTGASNGKSYTGNMNVTGLPVMYSTDGVFSVTMDEKGKPTHVPFEFKELTRGWYNVRFLDWDGQIVVDEYERGDQAVPDGGDAIAPSDPTRYGYTFKGWDKPFTNVKGPLIVNALYDPNNYDVTFVANANGDPSVILDPPKKTVTFDEPYGTLASVSRDYYNFVGWFTEPVGGIEVLATTEVQLAEDHNLYARWSPIVYTIVYVLDYDELYPGVPASGNPRTYTVESTFPINIKNPTKFAYDFQYWTITYVDKHTATLPTSGVQAGTTGNITLTAHWTPTQYAITYDLGYGAPITGNPDSYNVEQLPLDPIINPDSPATDTESGENYLFMGWVVNCANGTIVPGLQFDYEILKGTYGDIALTAQWLHMGGVHKSVVADFSFSVGSDISYDIFYAYEIPPGVEIIEKFEIVDSWYPINSLSYTKGNYVLMVDDKPITAIAEVYDAIAGSITFELDPDDLHGEMVTLTVTFAVENVDHGITNYVKVIVNDLYPLGTDDEILCMVSYDENWPDHIPGSGNVPDSYLYENLADVKVADNVGGLAVEGWVFIGWSTAIDGANEVFVGGDTFTVDDDTVFYAQWVPSGGVSKEFVDGSAGSYKSGDTVKYVVSYTIPQVGSGVSFEIVDTWTPISGLNFVSAPVSIVGGSDISLSTIVQHNGNEVTVMFDSSTVSVGDVVEVTFTFTVGVVSIGGVSNTATVKINDQLIDTDGSDLYRVIYAANGATSGSVPVDAVYYESGKSVVIKDAGGLVRVGYSFIGWLYDGFVYPAGGSFNIVKDTILYAQWVPSGGVTKAISSGSGSYSAHSPIEYVISYTIPTMGTVKSFEIVDEWSPVAGLSYVNAVVKVNGGAVTFPDVTDTSVDGKVTVTFDPSVVLTGSKIEITLSLAVEDVSSGISNTATVIINGASIGTDKSNLYGVTYSANGASGSVPVDELLYVSGASVTVLDPDALELAGSVFIGWLYNGGIYDGNIYPASEHFDISENVELVAQWVPSDGVSKDVDNGSGSYGVGDLVEYVIRYPLPSDVSSIKSFEIVDTYPAESLSYQSFTLTINDADFSSFVIADVADIAGVITFTAKDITVLVADRELILVVTFEVKDVSEGISNTATVNINNQLIGNDGADLYGVTYLKGKDSVTGSVPVDDLLYKSGATVTVKSTAGLELAGSVFIGWLYNEQIYHAGDSFNISETAELVAQWASSDGVSKDVVGLGSYGVGDTVEYVVSYTVPLDVGYIDSFEIVDTWTPVAGLSYSGYSLKVGAATIASTYVAVD